jgi:hypothetical protein
MLATFEIVNDVTKQLKIIDIRVIHKIFQTKDGIAH